MFVIRDLLCLFVKGRVGRGVVEEAYIYSGMDR